MFNKQFYQPTLNHLGEKISKITKDKFHILFINQQKITQQQLLIETIQLLLGIYSVGQNSSSFNNSHQESRVFQRKQKFDSYILNPNIKMEHLCNETMKNVLQEILKLSNKLIYIEKQTYRLYQSSNGLKIVRTFCQAVFEYLTELKDYFNQLLGQVTLISTTSSSINNINTKKITLLSLWNILSPKKLTTEHILKCLNSCLIYGHDEPKPKSIKLLDKMLEIDKEIFSYPEQIQKPFVIIYNKTLQAYLKAVQQYFMMRQICNGSSFFIIDYEKKGIFKKQQKIIMPEGYLHSNNEIQQQKLPILLQNHSLKILQLGKTIRFITQYYQIHEKQQLLTYLNINKQFESLTNLGRQNKKFRTFAKVRIQKKSVNDRLKGNKVKKGNKNKQLAALQKYQKQYEDNPYNIFTKIDDNFTINYLQPISKQTLKLTNYQKSNQNNNNQQLSIQYEDTKFTLKIKCILSQILDNINRRCLIFFQNQQKDKIISVQNMPEKMNQNRIYKSIQITLIGLKKFMLLEQGDFLEQFFNAATEILDKKKGLVTHNKLFSCIQEAIKNSSAKHLPESILKNVHFDFIKTPNKDSQNLRLWTIFAFSYELQGPISYIFTTKMMQKLKSVNNLIFCIKKSQILLNSLWQSPHYCLSKSNVRSNYKSINAKQLITRQKILRNSLHTILNSFLSYLIFNIDTLWEQYLQNLQQCVTIFQIIEESQSIVDKAEKLAISDRVLYNAVMMCLTLIQKFRRFCVIMNDPSIIVHITQIQDMDFQLRAIIQVAIKVQGLKGVIDFNQYYSKAD